MDRVLEVMPHLTVALDGPRVLLVGEVERFLLEGRVHRLVVPLIDGRRAESAIVSALERQASELEVFHSLALLEQRGYVRPVVPGAAREEHAYWQALGLDAEVTTERLASTPVRVLAVGGASSEDAATALAAAGVRADDHAALRVVVTPDYLHPDLTPIHEQSLKDGSRWMPLKPDGVAPWMGPIVGRHGGPCGECLAASLRRNRPVEAYLAARDGTGIHRSPPSTGLAASRRAALDLAALHLARWIAAGGRGALDDTLLCLDLRAMRLDEHAVRRRPECSACGDPDLQRRVGERPVVPEPRPKRFTSDGGYRAVDPEETHRRLEHLVSPITGIVASLGPVDGRHHPMRQVFAARHFVTPAADRAPAPADFARLSMGKGRTMEQARTGALAEALERHSLLFRGDEARIRARYADLGGEAIHPRSLLHFSDRQYRHREALNRDAAESRHEIPLPFDEAVAIEWTPAWSLTHGVRRWLPLALCYQGVPVPEGERFCDLDPNGHAAGNCIEEAILQGFFELCERTPWASGGTRALAGRRSTSRASTTPISPISSRTIARSASVSGCST